MAVLPNFLIIGAARSGTTALCEGLREHHDVFITTPKEPHYFAFHGEAPAFTGPGDESTINKVSIVDRDKYLALYSGQEHKHRRGDSSVSSLYFFERAIPEIQRLTENVKLVVLLRDPIERAYSAFSYMRTRGFEPEADFLRALEMEEERISAGWHHLWHYTRMSLYSRSVSSYLTEFHPGQVGVWFYESLERDYAATVNEVLTFLELPGLKSHELEVPRVNASGKPKSATAQAVIQRATRNPHVRSAIKAATTYRAREAVRRRLLRRSEIPVDYIERLRPLFREDVNRLRSVYPTAGAPDWYNQ